MPVMHELLNKLASDIALFVEAIAVILIAYGAIEALGKAFGHVVHGRSPVGWRRGMFAGFGVWLLLGLQFALAADILDSLFEPTWNEIGQLAAIAAIRTFLNYFLERDIAEVERSRRESITPAPLRM
jgi:uncharacterized membrane protein